MDRSHMAKAFRKEEALERLLSRGHGHQEVQVEQGRGGAYGRGFHKRKSLPFTFSPSLGSTSLVESSQESC